MKTISFSLIVLLIVLAQKAEAKVKIPVPIPWGTEQQIHKIQDIDGLDPLEDYYLGYVTERTHVLWIFGLYVSNEGYAVGMGDEDDNTGEFINAEDLMELKEAGFISESTPAEPSLSLWKLISGFSFWIFLAAIVGFRYFIRTK